MKMLSYNLCQVIIGDFQVDPFLCSCFYNGSHCFLCDYQKWNMIMALRELKLSCGLLLIIHSLSAKLLGICSGPHDLSLFSTAPASGPECCFPATCNFYQSFEPGKFFHGHVSLPFLCSLLLVPLFLKIKFEHRHTALPSENLGLFVPTVSMGS